MPAGQSFASTINCFYSGNQWVKSTYQNKKFDIFLDHLKKNIIFDVVGGNMNFSVHKLRFKNYHLNHKLNFNEISIKANFTIEIENVSMQNLKKKLVNILIYLISLNQTKIQ